MPSHELNALNIPNLNSQNPISYSNTEKFSFFFFCLSWNTNRWNFLKRDLVLSTSTPFFKPLFLCFFRKQ